MKVIVDNCIISSLAKIGELDLLRNFDGICTTQSVLEEAMKSDIDSIMDSVTEVSKTWLSIVTVRNPRELLPLKANHPVLSFVDCELILYCQKNDTILLTDDTKLIHIAEKEFKISTFDLYELLLALKTKGVLDMKRINDIISNLLKKDRYQFSASDLELLWK